MLTVRSDKMGSLKPKTMFFPDMKHLREIRHKGSILIFLHLYTFFIQYVPLYLQCSLPLKLAKKIGALNQIAKCV